MEQFPVTVRWTGTTALRTYSRDAVASAPAPTGGDKAEIPMSAGDPAIGDVSRWNPEDLLGASLAACHMLTFLALASKVGVDVRSYEGRTEVILDTVDRVTRVTRIRLYPDVLLAPGSDEGRAREMFEKAHKYCFIGNSITSEVVMEPSFRFA
jgi:organic hydroperoxide reductase OsmC/OhrA